MNNPTYQERVQAIADKMRQKLIETGDAQRLPDDVFIPILAVEAVKYMVEAYIMANKPHYEYDNNMLASGMGRINREMKEQGLIPDSGEPKIIPTQPGDIMYGKGPHDPDNPRPDNEKEVENEL